MKLTDWNDQSLTQPSALLQDGHGRRVEYLRLSVTDRCDLRCRYCLPRDYCKFEQPSHWLNFAEIERLVFAFARLGLKRVRLTGGEPLLRKNLAELATRLAVVPGIEDLSLSTNGTQLKAQARRLREAGVGRLNVSLDTLDRTRFAAITGRDVLPEVLAGLEATCAEGFRLIKINMVALADTTDDEVDAMTAYCLERGFVLRLIETMPIGEAGRKAGFVSLQPLQERLRARYNLVDGMVPGGGPARYLVSADGSFQIGFITPLSQHFCESCNRVRLTVDGQLCLCLGQHNSVDLRTPLRAGVSDAALEQVLVEALRGKPKRHEFEDQPQRLRRLMSATGG
ncbi:MAG: GTP 3',8-cyclase MoaA [Sterolibacterium sp.]|nr:GTP 3',8-cyclase MoaA [Sterolibacterium sp.]